MSTQSKANELLSEIDFEIAEMEKSLKVLQSQRKDAAKLIKSLGGTASNAGRRGRPSRKRTRTDWNKVIASFKGSFSIDDLAKASNKAKGTVNQAIQNLKKTKKIRSTGKRGEYRKVGVASKEAKVKSKSAPKKKAASKVKPKRTTSLTTAAAPAGTEGTAK